MFGESMRRVTADFRLTKNDFERRTGNLLQALRDVQALWLNSPCPTVYAEAIAQKSDFATYKRTEKRVWTKERQELASLYSNIQTKLRTYSLRSWEPREGLRLSVSHPAEYSLIVRMSSEIGKFSSNPRAIAAVQSMLEYEST